MSPPPRGLGKLPLHMADTPLDPQLPTCETISSQGRQDFRLHLQPANTWARALDTGLSRDAGALPAKAEKHTSHGTPPDHSTQNPSAQPRRQWRPGPRSPLPQKGSTSWPPSQEWQHFWGSPACLGSWSLARGVGNRSCHSWWTPRAQHCPIRASWATSTAADGEAASGSPGARPGREHASPGDASGSEPSEPHRELQVFFSPTAVFCTCHPLGGIPR